MNENECKAMSNGAPQCYAGFRRDGKEVYFVKAES